MNQKQNSELDKKCPKCQEPIQSKATKCKHCGADLRNWFLKHKIITGILVLVILTIVLSNLSDDSKTSNVNQSLDQQESSVPQEWQKIIIINTQTDKQSDTFHLEGGKQKILYTTTGGSMSMCSVYIVKEGTSLESEGGFPEASIDGSQTGETMARKKAGDYYLDISTVNGSCSVELQELR